MRNLNTYIIEKFKISKDIKSEIKGRHNFNRDEPLLRICLHIDPVSKLHTITVGFTDSDNWLIYFKYNTEDNGIKFSWISYGDLIPTDRFSWECTETYKINKYNLVEYTKENTKSLYLDRDSAMSFLNDISLDFKNINKKVLLNYFENELKNFDYDNIRVRYYQDWNEKIPELYNELKNEKS